MSAVVAKLIPRLSNSQGDAENADALVTQLRWLEVDASILVVDAHHTDLPDVVFMVLGHVVDSALPEARILLQELKPWIHAQVLRGAVLLAVGSAQGLLVDLELLEGHVEPRAEHVAGDIFVKSESWGILWGFENSGHRYVRAVNETALGTVVSGKGNDDGTDGVWRAYGDGLVVTSGLNGPLVVRNPELAQALIAHAAPAASQSSDWNNPSTGLGNAVALANRLREDRIENLGVTLD